MAWLLFCLIIGFSYSSILRSQLIAPQIKPAIDSLQEVIDSGFDVKVAIPDDLYSDILVTSNDPIHQGLYQKQVRLGDFRAKVTLCSKHVYHTLNTYMFICSYMMLKLVMQS